MNYDHTISEPDEEPHFIIVWHADERYSVDMPLAGADRSARVHTGTLDSCLDFIRAINNL